MEVILLERIDTLGQMGDVVKVKAGYARNYLLPQKKALRATKDNLAYFETQRAQLETENLKRREDAEAVAAKMDGAGIIVIRSAGDSGQLYGSVTGRDIANGLGEEGFTLSRTQVQIDRPIKEIGIYDVRIVLHPEVDVTVTVNVARSPEGAEAQAERAARGEDPVLSEEEELEAALDEAAPDVEELLEEDQVEAFQARQEDDDAGAAPEADAAETSDTSESTATADGTGEPDDETKA